ncbi:UNVERIFIED_CONTAM: hypothetical protein GTU68_036245 [Idotea baltica]|nr:hypothetical protein [Idotea baltica]
MCFKQYANLGYFTGVKKASW